MATFTVTTLNDENDGGAGGTGLSLREAIDMANAAAGADEIVFAPSLSGTIHMSLGTLIITDELTISGDERITLSGDVNQDDVLSNGLTDLEATPESELDDNVQIINSISPLTLNGMTLTGASHFSIGGAVFAGNGLTLNDMVFAGNRTDEISAHGAAVVALNGLHVTNSEFFGNVIAGPSSHSVIASTGDSTYINTTIADNVVDRRGVVEVQQGNLTIINSTITGNRGLDLSLGSATNAAVFADLGMGTITITDSIILGNAGINPAQISVGGLFSISTTGMNIIGSSTAEYDATMDPNAMNATATQVFSSTATVTSGTTSVEGGVIEFDGTDFFVALRESFANPAIDASAGSSIPTHDGRNVLAVDLPFGGSGPGARDLGAYEAPIFPTPFDDHLTGTSGGDFFDALAGDDTVSGLGGDDFILGYFGNDVLNGDAGDDSIFGEDGDDTLTGDEGDDELLGGAGNDSIEGGGNADLIEGGSGRDTLLGGTGRDTISGDENADYIEGGGGADDLRGVGGADTLVGGNSSDTLLGGGGRDELRGNNGADFMNGGGSADTLRGGQGKDTLEGGDSSDDLAGQNGDDLIKGNNGADTLGGGGGKDTIRGGQGKDLILGGDGHDDLSGQNGEDTISGGDGDDVIRGGGGGDRLIGAAGVDTLTGGAGADNFVFVSPSDTGVNPFNRDVITDFGPTDTIDLSQIDAQVGSGNQAFTFIGTSAFSFTAGELRYSQLSGQTIIQMDRDGDGVTDMEIQLSGTINLQASDFIL